MHACTELHGAGLGLRRELLPDLGVGVPEAIDFLEVAPENWMGMGGGRRRTLSAIAEQRTLVAHGLSLSLGGPAPLDTGFLEQVKLFLDQYRIDLFTEHLAWCSDQGHLYDLLPLPFTGEAVRQVAGRIHRTQEILDRRIAVENPSYYVSPPDGELSEPEFIRAVLEEADCDLHLDVNNVYVNGRNFGFDPERFIDDLPLERVVYLHVAGHYDDSSGVVIDTHGAGVVDPVWQLLERTYRRVGPLPTLLERDFNLPPLAELLAEVETVRALLGMHRKQEGQHADAA